MGVARVNGDLAVSRAFGDAQHKQTGGPNQDSISLAHLVASQTSMRFSATPGGSPSLSANLSVLVG